MCREYTIPKVEKRKKNVLITLNFGKLANVVPLLFNKEMH